MATFTEKQLFDRLWASFTTDGSGNVALRTAAQGLASDSVNDTHIDWGTGDDQVSAADIPLADVGTYFTTDNVEAALQQLAAEMVDAGAPEDATYILQTTNATLTNAQVLGSLATGLLKSTTTTGVLSIAAEGTDYYGPGGTDIPVTDGGTGASNAADARVNLDLEIGVDVQAYDAELAALAGLTSAADKLPYFTGAGSASVADFTAYGRSIAAVADEAAFKSLVNLEIGTDVQAQNSNLSTIAGLTATTDNFIVSVSSAWASRTPAQVKTTLSLDSVDNTSDSTKNSATATLTNKRVTPRVTSITSHATPSINTDNCDAVTITAQTEAITSMTSGLSGTPTNFQKLIIRIKDNGTARAITWGASFEAKGVALPTTTVLSKVLTVGFIYDTVTAKWGCVASAQEA